MHAATAPRLDELPTEMLLIVAARAGFDLALVCKTTREAVHGAVYAGRLKCSARMAAYIAKGHTIGAAAAFAHHTRLDRLDVHNAAKLHGASLPPPTAEATARQPDAWRDQSLRELGVLSLATNPFTGIGKSGVSFLGSSPGLGPRLDEPRPSPSVYQAVQALAMEQEGASHSALPGTPLGLAEAMFGPGRVARKQAERVKRTRRTNPLGAGSRR